MELSKGWIDSLKDPEMMDSNMVYAVPSIGKDIKDLIKE
jgi:hypothetical protein